MITVIVIHWCPMQPTRRGLALDEWGASCAEIREGPRPPGHRTLGVRNKAIFSSRCPRF